MKIPNTVNFFEIFFEKNHFFVILKVFIKEVQMATAATRDRPRIVEEDWVELPSPTAGGEPPSPPRSTIHHTSPVELENANEFHTEEENTRERELTGVPKAEPQRKPLRSPESPRCWDCCIAVRAQINEWLLLAADKKEP